MKKKSEKTSENIIQKCLDKFKSLSKENKIIVVIICVFVGVFLIYNIASNIQFKKTSEPKTNVDESEISYAQTFDYADDFKYGYAIVGIKNAKFDGSYYEYDSYTTSVPSNPYNYGVIDKKGNIIIPMEYENIVICKNGIFVVKKEKYGVLDKKGNTIVDFKYETISQFKDGIAIAGKYNKSGDIKYGLIDETGKVVVDFIYDEIKSLKDGVAVVKKGDYYGLIDTNGKVLLDYLYSSIRKFSDDRAIISKDGYKGAIDKTGKIILDVTYDGIENFEDGVTVAHDYDSYYIIDKNGNKVAEYSEIDKFKYGLALASNSANDYDKYGVIDKTGKVIVDFNYEFGDIVIGDGVVILNSKNYDEATYEYKYSYTFVDNTGKVIGKLENTDYDYVSEFKNDSAYFRKDNKYGLVDKTGKIIADAIYENIDEQDGVYIVTKKDKYDDWKVGLLSSTGNVLLEPVYESIANFENDLDITIASKKDKYDDIQYGIIDKKGNVVVKFGENDLYIIDKEYSLSCNSSDKCALLENKTGKTLTDFEYENKIEKFSSGLARVSKNNKWGYINKKGKLVIGDLDS